MKPERWRLVKQIYQEALDSEPGARAAFLNKACSGDETLRKEVESLLACLPECPGFLDSPAIEMEAKALAKDQITAPPLDLTGGILNHYQILEKIGEGGMGVVYHARDTHLDRSVAIKEILNWLDRYLGPVQTK